MLPSLSLVHPNPGNNPANILQEDSPPQLLGVLLDPTGMPFLCIRMPALFLKLGELSLPTSGLMEFSLSTNMPWLFGKWAFGNFLWGDSALIGIVNQASKFLPGVVLD